MQFSVAPIHKAAASGRVEFVELLLDRGANIDVRNGLGQTAYNIAGEKNFPAVQKLIRERGGSSAPQSLPRTQGGLLRSRASWGAATSLRARHRLDPRPKGQPDQFAGVFSRRFGDVLHP